MSHVSDIREICGDYAIDVKYSDDQQFTLFFNSRRNAQTVKRCIEVDDSIPNAATAVDFVEVVRCKDCKWYCVHGLYCLNPRHTMVMGIDDFCSQGERE